MEMEPEHEGALSFLKVFVWGLLSTFKPMCCQWADLCLELGHVLFCVKMAPLRGLCHSGDFILIGKEIKCH